MKKKSKKGKKVVKKLTKKEEIVAYESMLDLEDMPIDEKELEKYSKQLAELDKEK